MGKNQLRFHGIAGFYIILYLFNHMLGVQISHITSCQILLVNNGYLTVTQKLKRYCPTNHFIVKLNFSSTNM